MKIPKKVNSTTEEASGDIEQKIEYLENRGYLEKFSGKKVAKGLNLMKLSRGLLWASLALYATPIATHTYTDHMVEQLEAEQKMDIEVVEEQKRYYRSLEEKIFWCCIGGTVALALAAGAISRYSGRMAREILGQLKEVQYGLNNENKKLKS